MDFEDFIANSSGDFNQDLINEKEMKRMVNLISEFAIKDVNMAIFCLNSWRYNRPHISFYLTLNAALINTSSFGSKKIDTYKDFLEFSNRIIGNFVIPFEDEIVCDFGEFKIPFNNKYYPVFVGTGHNFTIPYYMSLDLLADELNVKNEILTVLDYSINIFEKIGFVDKYNPSKYDLENISIPSQEYFENVRKNYDSFILDEKSFLYNISNQVQKNPIKIHFLYYKNNYYPLFNPSILVDSVELLINSKRLSKNDMASLSNKFIIQSMINNFELSNEHNVIRPFPAFLKDKNDNQLIGNKYLNVAVSYDKKILVFLNDNEVEQCNLKHMIAIINHQIHKNLLMIVPDKYPRHRLFDITNYEVKFIVYSSNISIDTCIIKETNKEYDYIYLYDLISLIYQAKSIDYFVDFFFMDKSILINSIGFFNGNTSLFDAWQSQDKELSQGALNINCFLTDLYAVEWNSFSHYIEIADWYPFDKYFEMFSNPFAWICKEETLGFKRILNKAVFGFGGSFKKIKNSYVFLAFNMNFERKDDFLNIRNEIIKLVEELTERLINQFKESLYDSILSKYDFLQITYMPFTYARKVDNNGFTRKQKKYVFSDLLIDKNKCLIRFAINEEILMNDILHAKDKEIECQFFLELLDCFNNNHLFNMEKINNDVLKHIHDKKDIETISIDLDYVFSNKNLGQWPDTKSFINVRKIIACKCKETQINPGIYDLKNATTIIRNIQELIIPEFENRISQFDKYSLHESLLSTISCFYHNKRIDLKRFGITESDNLSDEAKNISSQNIIIAREENKHRIRTINYLIDTNLAINHINNSIASVNDISFLIAFSNWLIVLQDCADECHYGLFDAKVEIEDDFKVNTIYPENHEEIANERNSRVYNNTEYIPDVKDCDKFFENSLLEFKKDTGVDLVNIIQACIYLSKEFSATFKESSIPDVYKIKLDDLIKDYISILKNQSDENINKTINGLKYLIIDESKIKYSLGKKERFVPIWDRENRDNRFDIKPIVKDNEYVIFSPVVMYELAMVWHFGAQQFYPPYEYGLTNYVKSLKKWKASCEKQMEKDIEDLFISKGCLTKRSVMLHKIDKKYGHPSELGDYDVIAIDTSKKILWNIESKFLGKIGTLKEYYNHQDSFFIKDKKDEKFYRRIAYLNNNLEQILKIFGIVECKGYIIKHLMVTNKIFTSDIKKVAFKIITYNELEKELNDTNDTVA